MLIELSQALSCNPLHWILRKALQLLQPCGEEGHIMSCKAGTNGELSQTIISATTSVYSHLAEISHSTLRLKIGCSMLRKRTHGIVMQQWYAKVKSCENYEFESYVAEDTSFSALYLSCKTQQQASL